MSYASRKKATETVAADPSVDSLVNRRKAPKEREINKIGYTGPIVSKQTLRQIGARLTGDAKHTFKQWFKNELTVPKHGKRHAEA